jgi:hypothetical protein
VMASNYNYDLASNAVLVIGWLYFVWLQIVILWLNQSMTWRYY